MLLKRKARHLNAVSALGTIWWDSSKLDCRNTGDFLLMAPFREPSVLLLNVTVILEWKAHMRSDGAEPSSPQGLPAVILVLRTMRTIQLPTFYWTITMVVPSRPEGVQRLHPAPLCRLLTQRPSSQWESKQWSDVIIFGVTHKPLFTCKVIQPLQSFISTDYLLMPQII